jgi:hypothetical protein
MLRWLLVVAAIGATTALGFTAASAISATAPTAATRVQVGFKVGKFVKRGRNLVALGTVTTTATTPDGAAHSVAKPFHATVVTRGFRRLAARTCSVLSLRLDKLALTLLGLNVNLDKVVLTITANSNEGVLGSLFCQLAHTKVKLRSLAAYGHRLTQAVHKSGLSSSDKLIGFSVPVRQLQQSTATATCPILDLVLGPLHLDLLGLIVDLNQVHLTITANPTGGVLGSLFCSLSTTTTLPTTT